MQLSILLPTHRHDLMILSRIAQACSWASASIEVIVRDNSGNAEKRAQIAQFQRDHCVIISVDPCDPLENVSELMRLAKGDFIFCIADDDIFFDRAITTLPAVIDHHSHDPAVVGFTGSYVIESSKGSSLANYQNIDSDDVAARIAAYLSYPGPNVLVYSAQRSAMVGSVFRFMRTLPFFLSYHDQITCLLYLLHGKFVKLPRLIYSYEIGPWEDSVSAQKRDLDFYRAAGLDPAINKLQWFMCGFEGAVLIRNANMFPNHPIGVRQRIADLWFSVMFTRFKRDTRMTFDSIFAGEADKLCTKLQAAAGPLSFQDMLVDISDFFALLSSEQGRRYFEFWDAVLNKRQPSTREARPVPPGSDVVSQVRSG